MDYLYCESCQKKRHISSMFNQRVCIFCYEKMIKNKEGDKKLE